MLYGALKMRLERMTYRTDWMMLAKNVALGILLVFATVLVAAGEADVLTLVPQEYRSVVADALTMAGKNTREFKMALQNATRQERKGVAFLIANMPRRDLRSLKSGFLLDQVRLAYQVRKDVPWGAQIPEDIFLNDVLPYANFNEPRDNWRPDFTRRFLATAKEAGSIEKAALKLNFFAFSE